MSTHPSRLALLAALLGALSVVLAGCGGGGEPSAPASSSAVAWTSAPTGLRWADFNGMSIPAADQGPHAGVDSDAPHGFDRTPPGAALAAINATIRLSVATDNQWPEITRTLIAPGDTRDAFIRNRIQLSTTDSVPAGAAPTVQGYTVRAFTPDSARIDVVTRMPDGSLALNHTTVVWTAAGDWGLLLPAANATTAPVEAITTLPTPFVPVKES